MTAQRTAQRTAQPVPLEQPWAAPAERVPAPISGELRIDTAPGLERPQQRPVLAKSKWLVRMVVGPMLGQITDIQRFFACRQVGPWVFLDRFGPATMTLTSEMDVRPHPHSGLSQRLC